jgi:phosphoglycerate dehydrogenase-like enzyme
MRPYNEENTEMKKIVSLFGEESDVFTSLNEKARAYAASLSLEYVWAPMIPFQEGAAIEALKDADAGIIDIDPYGESIFKEIADRTKLLVRFGVGFDKVDLAAASRFGIAVCRTAGANTLGVAEMALTLILTTRRMIATNQKCVASGQWMKNVAHETIGSTLGIVGFGAIGQAVADLLKGFNCKILAYDPYLNEAAMRAKGVKPTTLEELFTTADAISLHLPYTTETHNLIGRKLLERMKPSSTIVNTSRGNIIDEEALYEVLASNKIAGAGLDVFGVEPLPLSSPLLSLENIVMTPHVSSQTHESLWRIYELAIDIASDFFAGREPKHLLNPEYRAR